MAQFPSVPENRLDEGGWTLVDESVETVFRLPTASVEGATRLYDDRRTREAARAAGGVDHQWRFFFGTRLTFSPPLPPGVGPAMVLPTVRSEANRAFVDRLAERGFTDVERGRRERVRTDGGARARLTRYRAELDLSGVDAALPVAGWVGVWNADGFRIGAGAYPEMPVAAVLDLSDPPAVLERDGSDYRAELLALIRAIE